MCAMYLTHTILYNIVSLNNKKKLIETTPTHGNFTEAAVHCLIGIFLVFWNDFQNYNPLLRSVQMFLISLFKFTSGYKHSFER